MRTVANVLAVRGFQADQALRDGADRIRAIVNTLVDGIITIDERGTIERMNPAAEQIFGYTAVEVVGRNVNVLMLDPNHRALTNSRSAIGTKNLLECVTPRQPAGSLDAPGKFRFMGPKSNSSSTSHFV